MKWEKMLIQAYYSLRYVGLLTIFLLKQYLILLKLDLLVEKYKF